jgi:hypothetical protein
VREQEKELLSCSFSKKPFQYFKLVFPFPTPQDGGTEVGKGARNNWKVGNLGPGR